MSTDIESFTIDPNNEIHNMIFMTIMSMGGTGNDVILDNNNKIIHFYTNTKIGRFIKTLLCIVNKELPICKE